jgi:hypothetical protein
MLVNEDLYEVTSFAGVEVDLPYICIMDSFVNVVQQAFFFH